MAPSITLLNVFVLLLLVQSSCLHETFESYTFKVGYLSASKVCNQSSGARGGSSLKLVNKNGPCSQIPKDHESVVRNSPSYDEEMLLQDQHRVDSIHSSFSKSSGNKYKEMQANLPVQSGIAIGTGNYLVTVALGSPKKEFTLIFDTGSDVTWTQCVPCLGSCYQQSQPIFDPTKSSSYKNISCSSASCDLLSDSGIAKGCLSSTCLYKAQYGDGSYSVGFFAAEKLTVGSSDAFSNFLFGCGQQNKGSLGRTAGLLGLGRGPLSLVVQTAYKYRKIFTYCIPSSFSSSSGHLTFGENLPRSVKFTPLSPDFDDTTFYGIDIIGISMGGYRLSIDISIFVKAGAIIDSGTVITRLPPTAYSALRSKFQEFMKDYPKTDGVSILDTCYDFRDYDTIRVPKIRFFFKGGVEVDINISGILRVFNRGEKVCLAFAPNSDDKELAIFGNSQQQTYDIVHDLVKGRIGFSPNGCS